MAFRKIAWIAAEDCSVGGSHSPGSGNPDIFGVDTKLGSIIIGENKSSDCICTSLNGLLRNLRRFSSSNSDQSIGSSSKGSEKVLAALPFSLLLAKMSRVVEGSKDF